MPHAIKQDHELSKLGLVTILIEMQGHKMEEVEPFIMGKWADSDVPFAVSEQPPIKSTSKGIPACALIGVDGTVLAEGSYGSISGKVGKLIEAELAKVRRGWGSTKSIAKARAVLHGKGDLAKARELIEELAQDAGQDEALAAEVEELREELAIKVDNGIRSIEHFLEDGRWIEAQQRADALAKSVKGIEEWESRLTTAAAPLEDDQAKTEMKLAKQLAKIMHAIRAKGPKGGEERYLRKLAEGNEQTRVGQRALRLAEIIEKANASS